MGNKRRIAQKIIPYFPEHTTYLEPFFGGGGMYFSKPKAKYNIVNDQDSEVYNLFTVISNDQEALEREVINLPLSEELFRYWMKHPEVDPVRKALRFIFITNFSFLGKGTTFAFNNKNKINLMYERIRQCNESLFGTEFANCDFRKFLSRIPSKSENELRSSLVYCDPPYLETSNNYLTPKWGKADVDDLFKILVNSGRNFCLSEFDHPYILQKAVDHNLNTILIGERQNLKNRRMEVLITNY